MVQIPLSVWRQIEASLSQWETLKLREQMRLVRRARRQAGHQPATSPESSDD